jgi:uncharacterized lipoprotein YajG
MKKIILGLFLLAGCAEPNNYQQIHDYQITVAENRCKNNGGVYYIGKQTSKPYLKEQSTYYYKQYMKITCQNKATFISEDEYIYPGLFHGARIDESQEYGRFGISD